MFYTTAFTTPFMQVLADMLLRRADGKSENLMRMQVILPTHRAVQTLKETLIARAGKTLLLPNCCALYDLAPPVDNIPPAMPVYRRLFLLTKLASALVATPDRAFKIALSLAQVLDESYQYEVSLDNISSLVDMDFAQHWNDTLQFLDIIRLAWPQILAEEKMTDTVQRQIMQIHQMADFLRAHPAQNDIILAGFDYALPAVVDLAKAICACPKGVLVLQGLDTSLTFEELKACPLSHTQSVFKPLLTGLNVAPNRFQVLTPAPEQEEFLAHAFNGDKVISSLPLSNITRIGAPNENDEALTCALLLRQTLETPKQRAVLVTNDRLLSRRVIAYMRRFHVILDDSAGIPLNKSPLGLFLMLLATSAQNEKDHQTFVSLLKHPLCTDGRPAGEVEQLTCLAEHQARTQQTKFQFTLNHSLRPLQDLYALSKVSFAQMLTTHLNLAEQLASTDTQTGAERLWGTPEGTQALQGIQDIINQASSFPDINPHFYPRLLALLLQRITIRQSTDLHPRLDILGPIEARFVNADVFILAGLTEGSWPSLAQTGVWFNRGMRERLKLPLPEEKTIQETRDFLASLCHSRVYLTYATKNGGTPTIPSRYFAMIESALGMKWPLEKASLARALQRENVVPCPRPMPCIAAPLMPRHLSVTQIRYLMENPYHLYVAKILNLQVLPDLESLSKRQVYGIVVHSVLEEAVKHPENLNLITLTRKGKAALLQNGFSETDCHFYVPRFIRIADWFLHRQKEKQAEHIHCLAEEKGLWHFTLSDGSAFELSAKIDRIDIGKGTAEIIDYKTGDPPSGSDVYHGKAPQLPLEALMIEQGAVEAWQGKITALSYWKLVGKDEMLKTQSAVEDTAGTYTKIIPKQGAPSIEVLLDATEIGLKSLLDSYYLKLCPWGVADLENFSKHTYADLERASEWMHNLKGTK